MRDYSPATSRLSTFDSPLSRRRRSRRAQLFGQDLARMDQVTNLITGEQCFALSLAKHFGDGLPEDKQACGHCTWCETGHPVELKKPPQMPWDSKAFGKVLAAVPDRDDARLLARVAFGIGSPRINSAKLNKDPVYGSMDNCNFVVCLTIGLHHCQMLTFISPSSMHFPRFATEPTSLLASSFRYPQQGAILVLMTRIPSVSSSRCGCSQRVSQSQSRRSDNFIDHFVSRDLLLFLPLTASEYHFSPNHPPSRPSPSS